MLLFFFSIFVDVSAFYMAPIYFSLQYVQAEREGAFLGVIDLKLR